jgi:two-component system, NarL family, nitrate/nitrite response regulator NarL
LATKVLVCHRDGLFADAIRAFLEAEGFQVTIATDLEEALHLAPGAESCLVDVRTTGALDGLRQLASTLRVLALVEDADPGQITAALRSGASGCVTTGDGLDRLVHMLSSDVVEHEKARAARERTVLRRGRTKGRVSPLTAREAEVLAGLVRGESTKALAARMTVSLATARTHVQNVLAKLGVHSRLQAVALGAEHPLGSPSVPEDGQDDDALAHRA